MGMDAWKLDLDAGRAGRTPGKLALRPRNKLDLSTGTRGSTCSHLPHNVGSWWRIVRYEAHVRLLSGSILLLGNPRFLQTKMSRRGPLN